MSAPIPKVEPRPGRQKQCRGACGFWLPIDCFSKSAQNKDGRRNECNACRSERRAELKNGAARMAPHERMRRFEKAKRLAISLRDEKSDHPWTNRELELLSELLKTLGAEP